MPLQSQQILWLASEHAGFTLLIQPLFLFLKNLKVAMATRRVVMKMIKVMTIKMTMMVRVAMTSQTSSVHCFGNDSVKGIILISTLIMVVGSKYIILELSAVEQLPVEGLSVVEQSLAEKLSAVEQSLAEKLSAVEQLPAEELLAVEQSLAEELLAMEQLPAEELLAVEQSLAELLAMEQLPAEELLAVEQSLSEDLSVVEQLPAEELSVVEQSLAEGLLSMVEQLVVDRQVDQSMS